LQDRFGPIRGRRRVIHDQGSKTRPCYCQQPCEYHLRFSGERSSLSPCGGSINLPGLTWLSMSPYSGHRKMRARVSALAGEKRPSIRTPLDRDLAATEADATGQGSVGAPIAPQLQWV